MAGKPVNFLIDPGATYSVVTAHSGPISSETHSVRGIAETPRFRPLTQPVSCQRGEHLVTQKFLVMSNCPTPLLGRDLLSASGAALGLPEF